MPELSTYEALESLYKGNTINKFWVVSSEFERSKYNNLKKQNEYDLLDDGTIYKKNEDILLDPTNINLEELILNGLNTWLIPTNYKNLDIENFILEKSKGNDKDRILCELDLYKKNNLIDLLKFLIYLVDVIRDNNIVCGVGRGSSTSSYILYLIGLHKINSIKYNLDINEFIR